MVFKRGTICRGPRKVWEKFALTHTQKVNLFFSKTVQKMRGRQRQRERER